MSYNPINWQNEKIGGTKVNATNLNIMDKGIADAHDMLADHDKKINDFANEQIPEEYVKESVDNYIAENQAGIASKEETTALDVKIDEVNNRLSSEIANLDSKFEGEYATGLDNVYLDFNTNNKSVALRKNGFGFIMGKTFRWQTSDDFTSVTLDLSARGDSIYNVVFNTLDNTLFVSNLNVLNDRKSYKKGDVILAVVYLVNGIPYKYLWGYNGTIYENGQLKYTAGLLCGDDITFLEGEYATTMLNMELNFDETNKQIILQRANNNFGFIGGKTSRWQTSDTFESIVLDSSTLGISIHNIVFNLKDLSLRSVTMAVGSRGVYKAFDVILAVVYMEKGKVYNFLWNLPNTIKRNGVSIDNQSTEKVEVYNKTTSRIFKKVVCCGDSYMSGHMTDPDGVVHPVNEDYSWVHYMSQITGNEWVNCGVSGANVLIWQSAERGYYKAQSSGKSQAYIIGLMVNDQGNWGGYTELGTTADIGTNAQTYYGGLSQIVEKLNAISPKAKIFICTCPRTGGEYPARNQAVKDVVAHYKNTKNTHCLDLYSYLPLYEVASFTNDSNDGHLTATGYEQCAEILNHILSEYINNNVADFKDVAFIEYE